MAMQNNYLLKVSRIITENTEDIGAGAGIEPARP